MPGPGVMASNKDAERNATKVVMDIVYYFSSVLAMALLSRLSHPGNTAASLTLLRLLTTELIIGDVLVADFEALAGRSGH